MLEDPQPKQCFLYAKYAQNKSKTLCSLLVFTQLFRTRNKEQWQYFSLSSLTFLDHMYLYVPLAPISRGEITVPVPFRFRSLVFLSQHEMMNLRIFSICVKIRKYVAFSLRKRYAFRKKKLQSLLWGEFGYFLELHVYLFIYLYFLVCKFF